MSEPGLPQFRTIWLFLSNLLSASPHINMTGQKISINYSLKTFDYLQCKQNLLLFHVYC